MPPESVQDRDELEEYLRRNVSLHLYELGDLDDFFWPHTTWYGHRAAGRLDELVMLFDGAAVPTLLALTDHASAALRRLVRSIADALPERVYAHLSDGLVTELGDRYRCASHGAHDKMFLTERERLERARAAEVTVLGSDDRSAVETFYQRAYPDNWFVPRMLDTGQYVGVWRRAELVCVAGVHVYSERYRVAALGNVATAPELRGHGLATGACAALCRRLLRTVDHIGLNVHADNRSAIACYRNLGFERIAGYEEWMLERR